MRIPDGAVVGQFTSHGNREDGHTKVFPVHDDADDDVRVVDASIRVAVPLRAQFVSLDVSISSSHMGPSVAGDDSRSEDVGELTSCVKKSLLGDEKFSSDVVAMNAFGMRFVSDVDAFTSPLNAFFS